MDPYVHRTLHFVDDNGKTRRIDETELATTRKPVIILAEPGMGKTWLLRRLAKLPNHVFRSAASFVAHPRPADLAPAGATLLIDGLDELSAAQESDPIYRVLGKLIEAGCPPFILSCRAADWRGAVARQDIADDYGIAPRQMWLEPFSRGKAVDFLSPHARFDESRCACHSARAARHSRPLRQSADARAVQPQLPSRTRRSLRHAPSCFSAPASFCGVKPTTGNGDRRCRPSTPPRRLQLREPCQQPSFSPAPRPLRSILRARWHLRRSRLPSSGSSRARRRPLRCLAASCSRPSRALTTDSSRFIGPSPSFSVPSGSRPQQLDNLACDRLHAALTIDDGVPASLRGDPCLARPRSSLRNSCHRHRSLRCPALWRRR